MQPITDAIAISYLRRDIYRFEDELRSIMCNIPRQLFGNALEPTAMLMVQEFQSWVTAEFIGEEESFVNEAMDWLADAYSNSAEFGLSAHTHAMLASPVVNKRFTLGEIRRYPSLVCTTREADYVESQGVRLTEEDRDAVLRYPQPDGHRDHGLQQQFEWCVTQGDGAIYALKEAGEILAYVACTPEFENIWDVAFIHVRDDCHHRGLGTRVAKYYAQSILYQDCIPYYSGANNPYSEKTARKAGFTLCREIYAAKATLMSKEIH